MRLSRRTRWSLATLAALVVVLLGWAVLSRLEDRRALEAEPAKLASTLGIGLGSRVADVGAGRGRLALAMAQRVGADGHVYATDINPDRRRQLEAAFTKAGLHNTTVITAGETETGLAERCCEAIYLRDVYHHLTDAPAIDADLERALEPSGRLLVIDFRPRWFLSHFYPVENVPADRGGHGVPPEVVIREVTAAGFTLVRRIDDWGAGNYALLFQPAR